MNPLLDLVAEALMLGVIIGLPLLGLGLVAGLAAGWLGQITGVNDPATANALRAAAVVLTVWWAGPSAADRVVALTTETWRGLAALGRGGVPTPPGSDAAP